MNAVPKRIPVTLNADDQRSLLAQPNPHYPTGERNMLMLKSMLDTGLRLAEATALEWIHIDLVTARVLVRKGKGAKDRALWLGSDLVLALAHWRRRQSPVCRVLPTHVFTTLKGRRLQHRYVQEMVRRYSSRAGLWTWNAQSSKRTGVPFVVRQATPLSRAMADQTTTTA